MFALVLLFAVYPCEIPNCDCGCQEGGVCRCLSSKQANAAPKVQYTQAKAPKRLTGDPRIDGGAWVRTCNNGRCTSRWVPLAELPESARRPVMKADKAKPVYVPRAQPQRRGLFGWR